MSPIWGLAVAALGVLTGLAWRFDQARSKDLAYFHLINSVRLWDGFDRLLIFSRPLGTKWALIIIIGLTMIWQVRLGLSLAVAVLIIAAIERGIKLIVKRPRPFLEIQSAIVRQNPEPRDASFPSGDATRVWFIFAAILFGIHPAPYWIILAGISVAAVSLGRVRLGVHYPLDVWAGAALGFGLGLVWSSFVM